jgi:hypothetical protein
MNNQLHYMHLKNGGVDNFNLMKKIICYFDFVTTPPEIIPYYRLNHSIWSLSDNKEASR